MSIGAVVGLLGSAVSAMGAIAQGNAAAASAKYNAAAQEQQARAEKDAASAEAQDYRRQNNAQVAAARAARMASGVTMAGSPLMVEEATVREIALGSARLVNRGAQRATRLRNEAELSRMNAKASRTAGYLNAGSSLLSGFGNAIGSW